MGIFVGWFVRGRWFFVAGFAIVVLAAFLPWPNHTFREVLLFLGLAIMAVQLPLIVRRARIGPSATPNPNLQPKK